MNKDTLKQIIIDQQEYYKIDKYVVRSMQLQKGVNYCFVGIRRAGKTYLMLQYMNENFYKQQSAEDTFYINFEDERFLEFTVTDFNLLLEIVQELTSNEHKPCLFLDEIQNIEGWHKFARRIADQKLPINITGSNSKMLSREIATTLGGRFITVFVYPYSFVEFLGAKDSKNYPDVSNILDVYNSNKSNILLSTKEKSIVSKLFNEYLEFGGFPEIVDIKNKTAYLSNIYHTLYLGDIIAHNNITNDFAVRLILKKLCEAVAQPLSFSRITNIVKSSGAKIGKQTVINYIGYMLESFLIFRIQNYASKLVDKTTSPKYYFMDTGILRLMSSNCETQQLENLVAIELLRRYGADNIFYFATNVEIDFYVPENNLAIQVCFSLQSDPTTKEREFSSFVKIRKFLPKVKCLVITNSEEVFENYKGIDIKILPAWKWLLTNID